MQRPVEVVPFADARGLDRFQRIEGTKAKELIDGLRAELRAAE